MPASSVEIAQRAIVHLLEINSGRCSITEAMIAAEEGDVAMGEILTGLLYLHEDLMLRDKSRAEAEARLLEMVARLEEQNAVALRLTTELKQAKEMAETATAAKSQFLAHMSHEVRTPMTALLGFTDLLLEPGLDASVRDEYSHIVRRNGHHLLSVVNDILDLSKIEAGKLEVERVDVELIDLLSDVRSLMAVRATERGVILVLRFGSAIPITMVSDATRLRQILLNLVANAIKFTSVGTVSIIASYTPEDASVVIEVVDTGIGMTSEELSVVFQPFRQGGAATGRRHGGTGLGLAISKALAAALGGELTAQSIESRGSTFTLRIANRVPANTPMVWTLTRPVLQGRDGLQQPEPRLSGRVLLAEDGPDNQLLFRTILETRGLEVTLVDNGRQAVALASQAHQSGAPYDVILMDMQMPELDGDEAARQLRRAGYTAPIVALTAHAMAGQHERCLESGCDDFMSKPVDRRALLAMVAQYVQRLPDR